MPPVIDHIAFVKLEAQLAIAIPAKDVNGDDLPNLANIKVFFGPAGSDLTSVVPVEFPGSYVPGAQTIVAVTVPAWATAYDFEVEVSN